ncbi:MAG: glycosyltransferase [Candidatus Omnitrophota bacterium]
MINNDHIELSEGKKKISEAMNRISQIRDKYIRKNRYYYKDMIKFLRFNIPENSRVLEIGCGTGHLLNALKPSRGVGIDISAGMITTAREKYPHLDFYRMDAEDIRLNETFDYVIISDSLGYCEDIQKAFEELSKVVHPASRIIITYHNFLWQPVLKMAEWVRLKMPQPRLNWLNIGDVKNLLYLGGFEIIKIGRRFLFPKFFPVVSWFMNKYIAQLPLFNRLCITGFIIARPARVPVFNRKENNNTTNAKDESSVSVIIPARNEKGNIENAIKRMPQLGTHTEIIFVEGHSKDDTLDEIKRVCETYRNEKDIKYAVQDGTGKADAVRKGFNMASGDILMILDADLTVMPEDLPKFYNAITKGKGEYINGSRLVYPMEKQAMRMLNVFGNKFFSIMFSWLLGQTLKDTLCGTKVISQKNWKKLEANRSYFGDFDPFGDFDLIFGAAKLNLKIVEIPIRYRAREYGETNISRFRHGWLLFKMVLFAMNKIKFI